ncbi:hypothetical protein [Cellulomonas sp. Leaf334]|uniref:hypothetical protein n=1 Tax=Cellulomonas sp. Leaf334 TaxID=1736339 RepID=UPI0006FB4D32|nr:hypothetical protein [Cellulomonas sp. Leaf334]KQR16563.1 hypothetical protein ASF78_04115 [Cellulomonas sp. Leaf334]
MGRRAAAVVSVVTLLALAGCTDDGGAVEPTPTTSSPTPTPTPTPVSAQVGAPAEVVTVLPAATASDAALEASRAVFVRAPVVVVAPVDDVVAQLTASSAAVALGAPVLLTGPGTDPAPLVAELERLDAAAVLVVGPVTLQPPSGTTVVPVPAGAGVDVLRSVTGATFGAPAEVPAGGEPGAVRALTGPRPVVLVVPGAPPAPTTSASPTPSSTSSPSPGATLPRTRPPAAVAGTVALTGVGVDPIAALATLRAAGVPVIDTPGGDPRATTPGVQAIAAAAPDRTIALGAAFGPADRLARRVATAATGTLLGGGGQLVFPQVPGVPGKKYVALYGTPGSKALGVLGEQDVPATLARADGTAAPYRTLTADAVVPAVEIIATIASAGPGDDGNYSTERPVEELRPLVEAAGAAGMAVVLDLQPGRTDFLTQAQRYADLLALPYVGLALDPEWRLAPDQVHLRQIGSVGIDEVNGVSAWLADFTAQRALPQKMFVLHQFAGRMIQDRARLDTSRDELAIVIHVDGQGSQPAKAGTWNALRTDAPPVHWGWKNFYDEDVPMLDPTQTYQVQPVPDLVTYQ